MEYSKTLQKTQLVIWLFTAVIITLSAADAGESRQTSLKFDAVSGKNIQSAEEAINEAFIMDYLLYLPDGYDESKERFPLLLFLHGGGESGSDIEKVKTHGPPRMIEEGHDFPMIVVSPQNPETKGYWDENILVALLDHIEASYRVDTNRVYLTGLSRGGFGAWCLAIENPHRFAALVPICGAAPSPYGDWLGGMPIWVFHGARDKVIPLSESVDIVEEIQRAGGNAKLTVYPEAGHDSWTETYDNPALWEWLLKQHLANRDDIQTMSYDPPYFNPPWEGRPYPTQDNPIPSMGGFEHNVLYSKLHNRHMGFSIVLPESYNKAEAKNTHYPAIFFLHGFTGTETADFQNSRYYYEETIKGNFPEVIMVFPNGMNEGYVDNPNGELFIESHIIEELLPHVFEQYRINQECVGVVGFSMGAAGAVRYTLKYPDSFNYGVAIDGSRYYFPDDPFEGRPKDMFGTIDVFQQNTITGLLETYERKTALTGHRSAILMMTGEKRHTLARRVFDELQRNGVPSKFISSSLEHDATLYYDEHLERIIQFERQYLSR